MPKSEMWVIGYDLHHPLVHWPTFKAMMHFIEENEISGFLFGGDQFNNDSISHHTKGKAILRDKGSYKKDERGFIEKVLDPLDELLKGVNSKIWIEGNHDFWEQELVQEQPELDGIQRGPSLYSSAPGSLDLADRGWTFIPCGQSFKRGHLTFIHGETLSGVGNQGSIMHSKKAVESYCGCVVYGHMHAPQTFTKVLPYDQTQKWQAHCMPIIGACNPAYLRNRPTGWLNGFGVVEFSNNGCFNIYQIIVVNGKFSFAGRVYGK